MSDDQQNTGSQYRTDDLGRTVDYGDLCRRVLAVGEGPPFQLIEAVAERIATSCLEAYPSVTGVQVRVRKLLPPLPATVAAAGVEIKRGREPAAELPAA